MKRNHYLIIAISAMLIFTACSRKNQSIENNTNNNANTESNINNSGSFKLTYTNLVDKAGRDSLAKKLEESGVKKEYIDNFIEQVEFYNTTMKGMKNLKDGFVTTDMQQVEYEDVYALEKWQSLGYQYQDFNCRLTSFELFRDFIDSGSKFNGDDIDLMMDLDSIERNPLSKFSTSDVEKFINLYSAIPTENTKDAQKHIDTIKKEWDNRQISFKENNKMSMINGFLHYYDTNQLFAGHAGILLDNNDELLFIEKYSFFTPYQISKFNDRKELYNYLMNRLDVDTTGSGAKPIIMENGEVMKVE